MKKIAVLGSTGSIGTQCLDIVNRNRDLFSVTALCANSSVELIAAQASEYEPELCVLYDEDAACELKKRLAGTKTEVLAGMDGLIAAACSDSDLVVAAVVGMIGIRPVLEAIRAGRDIALANKETLVTAGHIIMKEAGERGVSILPVDSEHSAIFQSLQGNEGNRIEKILLTASGGPFRGRSRQELEGMTVREALAHPNWDMGPKVTIDSSTLVNKGLEVMEAHHLFGVDYENIEVLVHPESILHSAVEYEDGAVMGQLGIADMRIPIQYAMTYPKRIPLNLRRLDLFEIGTLHFEKPDVETFPGLTLAIRAAKEGGTMPAVFNAANEEAVAAFLKGRIGYTGITRVIDSAMASHHSAKDPSLEEILATEKETRILVRERIEKEYK